MKDYNKEFQLLVNEAIKNGWTPIWIDRVEGNDCELSAGDITSEWFYFSAPYTKEEE